MCIHVFHNWPEHILDEAGYSLDSITTITHRDKKIIHTFNQFKNHIFTKHACLWILREET